jgi:secondary thiamine-phosphate synthase enzyme
MDLMRDKVRITTSEQCEFKEITGEISRLVAASEVREGICLVYCPHTTAGITINEHADPDVRLDLERAFQKLVPSVRFDHVEGNSPAHFLASVIGASAMIPVYEARLELGTWQGIFFCEFDGPRSRQVWVEIVVAGDPRAGE